MLFSQCWAVGHTQTLESENPVLILCFLILLQLSDKESKWASRHTLILVNHGSLECCVE